MFVVGSGKWEIRIIVVSLLSDYHLQMNIVKFKYVGVYYTDRGRKQMSIKEFELPTCDGCGNECHNGSQICKDCQTPDYDVHQDMR